MNQIAAEKHRKLFTLLVMGVFIFTITGNSWESAFAQDIPTETPVSLYVINGLSKPFAANKTYLPLVMRLVFNQNPTDILLSNSMIAEYQPINTVVGTLSTTDPNVGNTFTYSLVSGDGDTGNASFNISGTQLHSSAEFDYASQNSYSIRIRTTDQGGLFFEKPFTITVTPVIVNGNFELGAVGWTEYSYQGKPLIRQSFSPGVTPHDGTWAAWLGGEYDEKSYIQQQVTVPIVSHYLSYWHWILSSDVCGYDSGGVVINGSVVEVYDLCISTNTGGWSPRVVDLSAYAGNSVMLQIMVDTDNAFISSLFIDHVAFQATAKASNPVPNNSIDANASSLKQDVLEK